MKNIVGLKELREHVDKYISLVKKGESFTVVRRSKPVFYILKIDAGVPEEGWETVVDFTDNGKKTGMPAEEVMKIIKKIRR